MRACDLVAEFLIKRGIYDFFGFQGGAVTPLIDAMVEAGMKYHQCLHEQASGFAAEAWSRVTGKTGVVVVTNGPGVTNVVSSIANAHLDSTPCVFLLGQVGILDIKTGTARQNGFQEIDSLGIVRPICKFAERVVDAEDVLPALECAFKAAESGRKGAACLDLPMNMLLSESSSKGGAVSVDPPPSAEEADVVRAAEMLSSARRPVIVAGGGIRSSNAMEEFSRFVKSSGIPVVKTLMGLDCYCGDCAGLSGVYGHVAANRAVFESDVLLVLGSRLAKRQIGRGVPAYAPKAKVIHVDISPEELGSLPEPALAIKADMHAFLSSLSQKLRSCGCSDWRERVESWKVRYSDALCCNPAPDPVCVVRALSAAAPVDVAVAFDVGQNEMWCAQGWTAKSGQRIISSGGLGCMGFALPAAIGASVAGRSVWAFTGDGGLQMNIQELQTVASARLPVKLFVFNNRSLGMIQEGQLKYHGERYTGTKTGFSVPDIERIAQAYGLRYFRYAPGKEAEIASASGPMVVEIWIPGSPTRVMTRYDNPEDYD